MAPKLLNGIFRSLDGLKYSIMSSLGYRIFAAILLLFPTKLSFLAAQDSDILCTHYNINNGLLNSIVEYVYVDREGFVWFASTTGLQKFDGYNFTNYIYSPEDSSSVSYNFICTLFEDANGRIWIGTLKGLDVFNKENGVFYHLNEEPFNRSVRTINVFQRGGKVIAQDPSGFLWVNSLSIGLNKINTENMDVEQFHGDLSGNMIYDEELKVLWIASDRLKKFNIETKKIEHYYIDDSVLSGVSVITSIVMDSNGMIWLGTNAGIALFDRKKDQFLRLSDYFKELNILPGKKYNWSYEPITALYEDKKGFMWIAIDKSLYKIDKKNGRYSVYSHEIDNPVSLLDEKIIGIYGSNSGVLWITYKGKGASKVKTDFKNFTHYKHIQGDPNSIDGSIVRTVYKDNKRNLWIGMYNDGLNRITPGAGERVFHYRHDPDNKNSISSDYITAIYVDRSNRLWIGTFDKGCCFAENIYASDNLKFTRFLFEDNTEVPDIKEDAAGKVWIGTTKGFYIYNPGTKQLVHYGDQPNQLKDVQEINIQSILYEPPYVFWLATWNRGLCKLYVNSDADLTDRHARDSLVIHNNITDNHRTKIDNGFITIFRDKDSVIWLASNVNGLVKATENNGTMDFIKYDELKGAPDNSVYSVAGDKEGNIWISTNHGLGKFNKKTEKFNSYYESDGILSNAFVWDAGCESDDGEIFFGGINGLISFYPEKILNDTITYPVFISKLIVQNSEVKPGDIICGRKILTKNILYTREITLTHRVRAFSLDFVALNDLNPEETEYAYKLEGFDKDWIYTTYNRRYVTYTNLKPDTYEFLVKASNSDGVWNEKPAVLTIRILPPWWGTAAAIVSFSGFFVLLLYLFRRLILMRVRLIHEAKIEQMKREKAEELYNLKMKLFTDISHEFRTPLSLITAPLQNIISKVGNDPQLIRHSMLIRKNTDRLLRLIDQVMDMMKIDLNKMKLSLGKGDIVSYLKDLICSFEEIADHRSIILEFDTEVDSLMSWFDANKLDKIIYNLLSNSFKFTPDKGRIDVSLHIRGKTESAGSGMIATDFNRFIEITIKDNGIGMPSDYRDHLFERFYIGERHDSTVRRGTGIGLSLTKELIELHKGTISVESEKNRGTSFKILLPVITDPVKSDEMIEIVDDVEGSRVLSSGSVTIDEHEYAHEPSKCRDGNMSDRKAAVMLVVDDETEVREFITGTFHQHYQVLEAPDGRSGLEMALKHDPDIIITDIIMPVMDGVEMCRKIKSDIRTSHIPVIMLTARSAEGSRIEGLETGADAYLEKPFSLELLEAQIKNLLNSRKLFRSKFSRELVVKPADITITSVDADFIRKAIETVDKHMSDCDFGSDEFCRELAMSRSQMHRKLKALTSQPASEFVRTLRLKRAASLLRESHLTVEEVSYRVGFNSPAYFTKCFRSMFGKTPSEFAGK
jgi:signal transduction histidine kinase/ligand-binding sensor domain-containing protein/AraC-like DNA-binding protein/AmiR/NasT family two-component response regulator